MKPRLPLPQAARLTAASLVLLLAGCGMKGPLRHPDPPPPLPASSEMTPPTVTPAPVPNNPTTSPIQRY
ncbi:MAG: sugar transporter [Castellaniella sp.]|uniref:LPS translocon maturation chaperone LptM n=1 Tax=Castellaniella sp. TaxID=1955812 RepID=UPI00121FAF1E|nr:MAG: sugar transporter [Castellaniella sp.]